MQRNKYIGLSLALTLMAGTLASCSKDEDKIIVSATAPSVLSASTTSLTLSAEEIDATALTLSWTAPNLGTPLAIPAYALDITSPTTAQSYTLMLGTGTTSRAFTHRELNTLLKDELGAESGTAVPYTFALRSFPYAQGTDVVPSGSASITSEPLRIELTAVEMELKSPDFFLVGDFGNAETWNPSLTLYPLYQDAPDARVYSYTGRFKAGSAFKFVSEALMAWGGDYGRGASAGTLVFPGGDNITDITDEGYYTLTVNPSALSYTIEPYDASGATLYERIGLIGSAIGGWDEDVPLTQTAHDPHQWIGEFVLSEGELKFRANASWDANWGGTRFPVAQSDSGDNIRVSARDAGTYQVLFNDLSKHYHFRKK